jgi:hypothetical protein
MVIRSRLGLDLLICAFIVFVERVDVCLRQFVTGLADAWLKPINKSKIVVCSLFGDRRPLHQEGSCNSLKKNQSSHGSKKK